MTNQHVALPTIEWLPMVRDHVTSEGFLQYVNSFISILDFIIQNEVFVIIIPLVKGSLQLQNNTKVGDWFLFEQFTMIRVYGLEEKPYQK
jgi:hypothetical protein